MEKKRQKAETSGDSNGNVASVSISDLKDQISDLEKRLNDLKQVEEALRESQENFHDIFETVKEGIAYTTLKGKVLAVNRNLERMLGLDSKVLLGRNILRISSDLLTPENLKIVLPILSDLLHGRDIHPFQVGYKDKILEINVNINRSAKRLTGTIRDITESKRTEEALLKSEARLRRAELASRSGNWELHIDTGIMIGSEGAMKLYGIDKSVIDYSEVKGVPLPEYREMMDKAIKELISESKPYNIEFRIRNISTGELIDIHSICEYDSKNRILFGSIKDITDRKRAEEEIKAKSRDLSKLLEISMELLETVDKKKVFEKIVKGVPGHAGLEAGAIYLVDGNNLYLETSNPPLPENFPDEFRIAALANHPHIKKALESRTQVIISDISKEVLTPEEKTIAEMRNLRSLIYIPLFAGKKAVGILIFGTLGLQHDFSEDELDMCRALSNVTSLALENSILVSNLTIAKEKAEESDRLKTSFLHNISHEIRTPLNAIIGFSGFLDQPDLSEKERKEYIDIIFQSNNQLLSIINDILNISQIETGQVVVRESATDLNHVLKNLHRQFLDEAVKAGLDLRLNMPSASDDKIILTDESKLIQIFTNLLSNAIKFTHEGFVELGYTRNGDFAGFYVQDSGIGIPEPEHKKIFDRFYQVDKTVSRLYSGTGLGLAISNAYVELLGGEFSVTSSPGRGSRFSFRIPWKKPVSQTGFVSQSAAVTITGSLKKTILVAEDEESNFALVHAMLKPHGYNTIRAKNGRLALDLCKSNPDIELILMDIKMPVMDGFEATREILKIRPNLPIIAQTAYAHPSDRIRALETGCSDYLAKPFDRKQLLEVIAKYLK